MFSHDREQIKAGQPLQNSEVLRLLVEHAPAAIAMLDREMRYVLASQRWIRDYNLKDDILGCSHYDLFPEISDDWRKVHQRGLAGEISRAEEDRFERADGAVQWIRWEVRPWYGIDGQVGGLVIFSEDVTTGKQAKEQLRQSLLQYQSTFENAAVGMSHVSLEGRWLKVNERLCQITGYTREELLSMTFEDVTYPGDIEPDWVNARRLMAGEITSYTMEKRYIRKDERLIWINLTVSLLRDEAGAPLNFISVIEDITARKQAEDIGRDSEARFATLADNMSQLAWMADADGWIFWYNRRWYDYTGTTFEEMQGWGWKKVHHPDQVDRVEKKWREAHATGHPWEDTFPLRSREGVYHWFLSRAQPIRDSDGRIVRWFGTNTDITEIRDIQTSLRESEHRLQALAAELEHRIQERTSELQQSRDSLRILATELNLAEQRERKRLAGELHDCLAQWLVVCRLNLGRVRGCGLPPQAEQTVNETEAVLSKALNYSRTLMAELSPLVLQEHGLVAALKWLAEQFQRHDLTVTVDVGTAADSSLTDDCSILLYQSVRELLMNTLKHAQTNEAVIRLDQRSGELRITVSDHGVGFDIESVPTTGRMLSQFGLFSLRERMKTIGGYLDVQSQPGQGTQATLVLPTKSLKDTTSNIGAIPVYAAEQPNRPTPSSAHRVDTVSSVATNRRTRVLLVDDHAMVRQGLRSILEGYPDLEVVGEGADGEEAVALVERLQPAVVVMDINMPKMNGIMATSQIKTRFPTTNVIGLSVNAGAENQEAMTRAGASVLITKEAAVQELHQAICDAVKEQIRPKHVSI